MSDADRRAVEKLEDTRLGLKEDDDDNDLLGGRPSDFKALLKTKEKQVSVPSCRRTTRAAARTPRLPLLRRLCVRTRRSLPARCCACLGRAFERAAKSRSRNALLSLAPRLCLWVCGRDHFCL